ncbi:MAG: glycosyltransferase [Bryobacteraceae bacterium]
MRLSLRGDDAIIFRVPSIFAAPGLRLCRQEGRPYGLEVVGDPFDVFAPGANFHILRPFFRFVLTRQLTEQCKHAGAIAYVSKRVLPLRYPGCAGCPVSFYPDTELGDDAFVSSPRKYLGSRGPFRIICVGSFAQRYKGQDTLVRAFDSCCKQGADMTLTLVGDGACQAYVESVARELGCLDRTTFAGHLSNPVEIRRLLDSADLFVLPSRTEGLPGALIEAMARALPCIGTCVGGVPELLAEEDLVECNDAAALTHTLLRTATDTKRLARMSARNLKRARDFSEVKVQGHRETFFREVRSTTQNGPSRCRCRKQ